MAEMFGVDIAGRVKNYKLKKSEALFPLFEAVVNSIQAIDDRREENESAPGGEIEIEIVRDSLLPLDGVGDPEVAGLIVRDNGIGFNEANFKSFLQSDSTYKERRGGKGVGRFCWLKVFSNARIVSNFQEGSIGYCRSFDFNLTTESLDDSVAGMKGDVGTVLTLSGITPEFKHAIPRSVDEIAVSIMHHCALFFLLDGCPSIVLKDEDRTLSLNDEFIRAFKEARTSRSFNIKGHDFELTSIRMDIEDVGNVKLDKKNRVMLCANNRCVEELSVDDHLKGLGPILKTKHKFYYLGILTGGYLEKKLMPIVFRFPLRRRVRFLRRR
ncbi:MAG: ATP-binding protein [Eggerthellaceae bacterium]